MRLCGRKILSPRNLSMTLDIFTIKKQPVLI